MRKPIILILTIILYTATQAQYYYKDMVVLNQSARQWQSLKANKVKSVKLASFEADNQPSDDFSVEQSIRDNYGTIVTSSKTIQNGSSQFISSYDPNGQLIKTIDTSEDFSSTTSYQYQSGKLSSIINNSSSAGQINTEEVHQWFYDAGGKPSKMLRIRNGSDTTTFTFVLDEKGNVVEEHGMRRGVKEPVVYYYYDDQNRLTDVVRFSVKARRLLPTNVFGYDEKGNLVAMLLVPEGTNDYQRWYYDYDERGLKVKERLYDKQQRLIGKVEYSYQ